MIVGAKKREQLVDNIAATKVVLPQADLRIPGEVSELPLEYPGWVFEFHNKIRGDQIQQRPRQA